ncbi:hypothetical protein NUM3379_09040 [Kineococcus sp. NUM-3379]
MTVRHPEPAWKIQVKIRGDFTVRITTATARLAAVGALSTAAFVGPALAASAYAPPTPTPSASVVPTPSATPSVSESPGATPGATTTPTARRTQTPAAVAAAGEQLAYTGTDVLPWATAGAVLVAGGAALVVAGRRRPAREH